MATANTESELILDFFAGSGTTGHATYEINADDAGNRRFILVQLPETTDRTDHPTISSMTKERLRQAARKIKDENSIFAGDLGFRVFKLDSTNIREWDPKQDNIEGSLQMSIEHLKTDRKEADILYELLLKLGLDLCVPIETCEVMGKDVHSIGGGVLMACLSERITAGEVEPLALGVAAWHKELAPAGDTSVVFRDSAFADDVAKTNCAAILEQHGLGNVRSL